MLRTYLSVGISTSGRRGPFSRRASVPLSPAPPAPSQAVITYDETGVTMIWKAAAQPTAASAPSADVLESKPIACGTPPVGFHVYELGADGLETRLTQKAVVEPQYIDRRVDWGAERCYTVRTVHTIDTLAVESEPAAPTCVALADTFPPQPPKGLVAIASEGAISLIWDASPEADLAGYLVLRAPAAARTFAAVTPEPVQDTTFNDKVEAGTPFVYAIQAVDKAGNRSNPSVESTPEAAR
jgi:hypothetical protein